MYKLLNFPDGTELDMILRKEDSTYIPKVVGNKDYDEYLEWVAEGNTPEPADE